jgi:hypothetical protein
MGRNIRIKWQRPRRNCDVVACYNLFGLETALSAFGGLRAVKKSLDEVNRINQRQKEIGREDCEREMRRRGDR